MSIVDVVSFRDTNLGGMHNDGRLQVDRRMLVSRSKTLEVLVHDKAHDHGGDGTVEHARAIERIWSTIVAKMTPYLPEWFQ